MISYAQNREDVLLQRLFRDVRRGFYVDVGAGHPDIDSVTRWFYDQGWRGINIEPREDMHRLLARRRQRDVNLNIAVSDESSQLKFFHIHVPEVTEGDSGELSTLDPATAEQHQRSGKIVTESTVLVETLTRVLAEHQVEQVTFLKIDVEGFERQVIAGLDWKRVRPRVVVVEATLPQTTIACHASWEPLLLDAQYLYATFDGLNRYYVRAEDRALLELLQVPVNVLDDYVPSQVIELQRALSWQRHVANATRLTHWRLQAKRFLVAATRWCRVRKAG